MRCKSRELWTWTFRLFRRVETLGGFEETWGFGAPGRLQQKKFVRGGIRVEVPQATEHLPDLLGVFKVRPVL